MRMEQAEAKPRKIIDLTTYGTVVGFLCIEVLALISFYLGHSFLLYGILSVVLVALLLLVTFRQIKKDGITTFAFFLFPVFVFGLLTALSQFNYSSVGAIGVAESVFVPIALTCLGLAGFLSSYIKGFKIKQVMIVIYGALAIFVLINLFITMIYYVPFYTLIYKNSYIVYNGKPSVLPIGSMAYMLFGFQVEEVTIEYWSLFPSILLTSVIPLFFIKFKENKRDFLIYLSYAVLAFLSLLFTISKYTIITDVVLVMGIAIIVLAGKIKKSRDILNGMMIAAGIILVLVLIFVFLIAQTSWGFTAGIKNFISSKEILNRLFIANRFASKAIVIFQDLFSSFKLFGVPVGGYDYLYPNGVQQEVSNIWLFDNLLSSGLFGAVFFLGALVIGIRRLFKYLKENEDDESDRYLIAGYVLGFLAVSLLLFSYRPLVNSDKLFPFFTSSPLLVAIFLLGYTFNRTIKVKEEEPKPAEEVKVEVEEEKDEKVITL